MQERCLFNKITVYGLLVDYKTEKITKVYELVMDFSSRKSSLREANDANLDIADGFLRTTLLLKAISCPYLTSPSLFDAK